MKSSLFSTLITAQPVRRIGQSTPHPRLIVNQKVHDGPKPTIGRQVELVMEHEEAALLVYSLLKALPIQHFESDPKLVDNLEKLVKVLRTAVPGDTP